MHKNYTVRRPFLAFITGAGISALGGLIGLGGAEFRLPILLTVFALYAHRAVRFNLLVSLVTLIFASVTRLKFLPATDLASFSDVIIPMIAGGMISAWIGAGWLSRIEPARLMAVISALLLVVAVLLFVEGVYSSVGLSPLSDDILVRSCVAILAGLLVGVVSSLLGVAGGEFIIPILIFIFGADIKSAGTLSLLISLPIVVIGVAKHWTSGHYRSQDVLTYLVLPMSAGSVIGASFGSFMATVVPGQTLKIVLAAILAWSAIKIRLHR